MSIPWEVTLFAGTEWVHPATPPHLPEDEVHVWRVRLDVPEPAIRRLARLLSSQERERASRFYRAADRLRFIISHGALRSILGRYLDVDPHTLIFAHNGAGKPLLSTGELPAALQFNLSHSSNLALIAVSRDRPVGVDVEYMQDGLAYLQIARRFFSPRETAVLASLPVELQMEAFYNCWTRKEAYLKARGQGLSMPLNKFEVSLIPGEPAVLVGACGDDTEVTRWSLRPVYPEPGYAAALVGEGFGWELKAWHWCIE